MASRRGKAMVMGTPQATPRSSWRRLRGARRTAMDLLGSAQVEEGVTGGEGHHRVVHAVPGLLEGRRQGLDLGLVAAGAAGGVAVQVAHQAGRNSLVPGQQLTEGDRIGEG